MYLQPCKNQTWRNISVKSRSALTDIWGRWFKYGMWMIWWKFRFFVKVWRYKMFKTAKLVKSAENGVRIQVRNGEMWKSAKFGLHTTQTDPKSAKIGKSEFSPLFWQREKYKRLRSSASVSNKLTKCYNGNTRCTASRCNLYFSCNIWRICCWLWKWSKCHWYFLALFGTFWNCWALFAKKFGPI